jgi:hypothetical protein
MSSTLSPARKRYNKHVLILSAVYGVTLILVLSAFARHMISGPLAYLVGILPALPIIGIFLAVGRYLVNERDEYLRMLMVRQSLIASGFMLSVASAWGFLESVDLVPHVDAYYAAILWFLGLGVGAIVNKVQS